MASYVVMEPPRGSTRATVDDGAVFIRDGFMLVAFLVPLLWFLWHRLWIEAALAFAVMVGLAALGNVAGFGAAAPVLSLLVSVYVGLEAAALRIAALRRRGWSEFGAVEAESYGDAETRYLVETGAISDEDVHGPPPSTPAHLRHAVLHRPAVGLLLNPGRS